VKIRTVCGDIDPKDLGITDSHNHIYINLPDWVRKKDPDFALDNYETSVEEMKLFKQAGGRSFVDCTAIDYGRDVVVLQKISKETGVNIIAISGFKEDPFFKVWLADQVLNEKALEDQLVKEIEAGVDNSGIHTGVLKASTSYNRITATEEKLLHIVARAQKRTGAPIVTHCTGGTMGLEQLDIFESEGVDLSRVSIGHGDLNPDAWIAKSIAGRGAFVCYDNAGKAKYHPDSQRIEVLSALVASGYENNVLLGMDIGRQSDCKYISGGLGHGWLLSKYIPRLKSEGFSQDVIDKFLVENPKRWLAF
jgi:predicted metal-dependent phosphotriesterase family hydrolase